MKKIIAMLLACMMVIGLAACGGGADTTTAANDQPAGPEAVTLKVWAPQEDQADANCWLPQIQKAFEAAHPEYVITWDNVKEEVNKILEREGINWRYVENENVTDDMCPLMIFKIS